MESKESRGRRGASWEVPQQSGPIAAELCVREAAAFGLKLWLSGWGLTICPPWHWNTSAPKGCVLSPPLFSFYTYDYTSIQRGNPIIKLADSSTGIGHWYYRWPTQEDFYRIRSLCWDKNIRDHSHPVHHLSLYNPLGATTSL